MDYKILKITKEDIKKSDSYWSDYVGEEDVSDFDGAIEIAENLGYVKFKSIKASRYILAKAGSGIEAGYGIEAGDGIKAGSGIEAGFGIEAGDGIEAGYGIEAGFWLEGGGGDKRGGWRKGGGRNKKTGL